MTEPVAYRVDSTIYNNLIDAEYAVREIEHLRSSIGMGGGLIPKPVYIEPLYTAEQLHPRVKMTQKQLNAFTKWNKRNKLLSPVELIWNVMGANEYPNEFGLELQEVSRDDKYLLSLANIWSDFDPDNPEETIEIVPDMKWFVRSKEPEEDEDEYYIFLSGSNLGDLDYLVFDYAKAFDTKEEAEKWTNPLTEAVHLPVEGE